MPVVAFTDIYPDGPGTGAAGGAVAGSSGWGNPGPWPELPIGALPFSRDVTVAAAGTVLLMDPGAGYQIYLTSAFVSTDTAMRIAVVDDVDIAGQRPVDGYFAANGGATPNLTPDWYQAKNSGNRLYLVTALAGNVKCRVSGFTLPG